MGAVNKCSGIPNAFTGIWANVFKPKYLRHIYNQYTDHNNIIVLQIFQYLYRIHSNITELELIENE